MFVPYANAQLVALKREIAQTRPPTARPPRLMVGHGQTQTSIRQWGRAVLQFRRDYKRLRTAEHVHCILCGALELVRQLDPNRLPAQVHLCRDCRPRVAASLRFWVGGRRGHGA